MRAAFVFDPDRCTSCEACRIACGIENNAGLDTGWRKLTTFNPSHHPSLPTKHLSLACNHCDTPACAIGCPANAYQRDEATGAVIIDPAKCIGCHYCSWVCPYDAPTFDKEEGVMTKCTFCSNRLSEGHDPACVEACPTDALTLGQRENGEPEPSYHGLGKTSLGPSLKVLKQRRTTPPPALAIDELLDGKPMNSEPPRKITLRGEWGLLLFTLIMPALVAWFAGGLSFPERTPGFIPFVALAVLSMAVSTLHLGKPLRAWRAVLNVKTSWLSREIVFANAFLGFGAIYTAFPDDNQFFGIATIVSGLALCISIDGVYRAVPRLGREKTHSAETTLTVLLLGGIAAGFPLLFYPVMMVKGVLFLDRIGREPRVLTHFQNGTRLMILAMACALDIDWRAGFALALAGEVFDRTAFYLALEPSTPASRMVAEAS